MIWFAMSAAGGLGAVARYLLGPHLRWRDWSGTTSINLIGTALLVALILSSGSSDTLFVFGVGFLGGFTTFSTWMLETLELAQRMGPAEALRRAGMVTAVAVAVASLTLLAG